MKEGNQVISRLFTTCEQEAQELRRENDRLRSENERLVSALRDTSDEIDELRDCKEHLRQLGRYCGCDHVHSPDERSVQVQHICESFDNRDALIQKLIAGARVVDDKTGRKGVPLHPEELRLILRSERQAETASTKANRSGFVTRICQSVFRFLGWKK